jgi:hypothetical protein
MSSEENQTSDNSQNYKTYSEERKILISAEQETAQQFDKYVLTLAAGALALSITFINQIAPSPKPYSLCLLLIAWVLFSLSILSTLISQLASQSAFRRQREILDQWYENKGGSTTNNPANWTNILNYLSIALFIFGTFAFILFSTLNIFKEGNMSLDSKNSQTTPAKPVSIDETRGLVPPTPPIKPPAEKKDIAE